MLARTDGGVRGDVVTAAANSAALGGAPRRATNRLLRGGRHAAGALRPPSRPPEPLPLICGALRPTPYPSP